MLVARATVEMQDHVDSMSCVTRKADERGNEFHGGLDSAGSDLKTMLSHGLFLWVNDTFYDARRDVIS